MKSTYEINEEPEYPLFALRVDELCEDPDADFIVLFTSMYEGTVVYAEKRVNPSYRIGTFLNHWTEVTDEDTWKILPKGTTITITS